MYEDALVQILIEISRLQREAVKLIQQQKGKEQKGQDFENNHILD